MYRCEVFVASELPFHKHIRGEELTRVKHFENKTIKHPLRNTIGHEYKICTSYGQFYCYDGFIKMRHSF